LSVAQIFATAGVGVLIAICLAVGFVCIFADTATYLRDSLRILTRYRLERKASKLRADFDRS